MADIEAPDLKEYEAAIKLMNHKKYQEAGAAFQALIRRKGVAAQLVQAAVVRQHACQVRLNPPTLAPKGFQECTDAAAFCLNRDELDQAAAFLAQAKKSKGDPGVLHYLEAALLCKRGDSAKALEALGQALAADPTARFTAQHDPDFEPLHALEGFRKLL
jgi:tetratricopeptide (TPR) repeat protein